MDQVVSGKITAVNGWKVEIDHAVWINPTSWGGMNPCVGDLIEITYRHRDGKVYISAYVRQDPATIVGERVRCCGDWASAERVEAELRATWPPDYVATVMAHARENAKLTDEEIKAGVARMWNEVWGRARAAT